MNPTLSLRILDKKVDNMDREHWEEIKGVESKVMENMTSIETNILDAVTKSRFLGIFLVGCLILFDSTEV
ncbi:hypothetical protein L3X38_018633 [Prunus dulcis]|uniref:Uncharacterized protein n=1 Tax=Prunus dulcis TaxID=3755 RepID=A0AAD4WBZ1_PRUDU|nr:hypothetical protein L3X38_018633 [Prunus dulcis]